MDGLIVLHGVPRPSGFALWAEGLFAPREGRDRHPRDLEPSELLEALGVEGLTPFVSARAELTSLMLAAPAVHGRPVPSAPALREPADYAAPFTAVLRTYEVPALVLPMAHALETLLALPAALRARPLSVSAGDDLDYWAEVARWVFDLLLRRRVAPGVDGGHPRWRPVLDGPHERERLRRLAEAMPPVSRAVLPAGTRPGPDGALPAARGLLLNFLDDAVDAAARDVLRDVLPKERRRAGDSPEAEVVAALAAPATRALEPGVLARLSEWSLPLLDPLPESLLRLGIRVVPPASAGGTTRLPRRSRLSGRGSRSGRLPSERRARTAGSSARVGGAASAASTSASGESPARRRSAGRTSLRTSRAAASTASSRNARSSPRAGGSAPSGPRRTPGGRIARDTGGMASARRRRRSLSWGSSRTGRQRGCVPSVPGATRRRSRRSNTQRATSAQ